MKKLFFIGLIFISGNCFSQGFIKGVVSRLTFGLKAGANYSDYTGADFGTSGLVGFHAGGIVNFRFTDNLSFQEEFLFSTQGAKLKEDQFGKEKIDVSYVTVPLLLKYRMGFGLYIEGGMQEGLRVDENTTESQSGSFAKRLDMAAIGGLGFQSKSGFGIGVRYVAGLSNVGNFTLTDVSPDFKTSVMQASVFYIF
jgi:hypothetical protein